MLKILKYLVFALILGGLFWVLKDGVNSTEFQTLIVQADKSTLLGASLLVALGLGLKAWRLQYLVHPFGISLTLLHAFKIQVISISLAMLTPGRAGEFSKVYFLDQGQKRLGLCLMLCIFERLFDFLVLVFLALLFSFYYVADIRLFYALAGFGICLLIGFGVMLKPDWFLQRFLHLLPPKLQSTLSDFQSHQSLLMKQTPVMVIMTLITWVLDALFHWLIFYSVGHALAWVSLIGLNAIMALASIVTILPVGLGSQDLSALFLYPQIFGLSKEVVLFELMASRVLGLGVLFLFFIPAMGGKEKQLLQEIKDAPLEGELTSTEAFEPNGGSEP